MKFDTRVFFETVPRKSNFDYNLREITGTIDEDVEYLWLNLTEFFLEWEMFQIKFTKKITTRILCSVALFRKWCCLWDNVEKCGTAIQATDGNVILCMCFPCRTTKTTRTHTHTHTHTHTQCNTFCFSTSKMLARTRHSVTLCYTVCLVAIRDSGRTTNRRSTPTMIGEELSL
jgi:hypothetical protein